MADNPIYAGTLEASEPTATALDPESRVYLPVVDPDRLRRDVDAVIDPSLPTE